MNIYDSIISRLEARARTPADRLDAGRLRQELARLRTQVNGLENEIHQLHLEIQDAQKPQIVNDSAWVIEGDLN